MINFIITERDNIQNELEKLVDFTESCWFDTLKEDERIILLTQQTIMGSYVNILNLRIKAYRHKPHGKYVYQDNFDMAEERELNKGQ